MCLLGEELPPHLLRQPCVLYRSCHSSLCSHCSPDTALSSTDGDLLIPAGPCPAPLPSSSCEGWKSPAWPPGLSSTSGAGGHGSEAELSLASELEGAGLGAGTMGAATPTTIAAAL